MPSLLDCRCGDMVRIESIPPELDCGQRLRELGILEGATVILLRRANPVLILVKDCRIALDPATAAAIAVSCDPEESKTITVSGGPVD